MPSFIAFFACCRCCCNIFSPEVTIVVAIGGQGEACADALVTRFQLHARLNMMMIYYMYR